MPLKAPRPHRILVDVDDVLAHYKLALSLRILESLPTTLLLSEEQRVSWSIVESYRQTYGDEAAEQVQELTCGPGFFANLRPVDGAIDSLEEMLRRGYDVALVTAPLHRSPTCASEKLEWVGKHLGHHWLNRTIIASEKFRVDGDVLIDDNPLAAKAPPGHEPRWQQVLFIHEWNERVADTFPHRMGSWAEWECVVIPLLEQA